MFNKSPEVINVRLGNKITLNFSLDKAMAPDNARYPGEFRLDPHNSSYLQIDNCGWDPMCGTTQNPRLNVTFTTLKLGSTSVTGYVQLSAFNPLFVHVSYCVVIEE